MQELTFKDCRVAPENTTGQLIDSRDNKAYLVTKLKDGNCWMTQNLDFDGGGTSTSASSWPSSNDGVARYYDSGNTTYGNYYSWEAAKTVCPNGWALPSGNSTTTNGSFGKLTTAYGIGNNAAGSTALRAAPLNFVYGGFVNSGTLRDAGSYGYYWSSTAQSGTFAYILVFVSSNVYPSNSNARYLGQSVRCLVQGS